MRTHHPFPRAAQRLLPSLLLLLVGLGDAAAAPPPRPAAPDAMPADAAPLPLGLPDLIRISLERNPALAQARLDIDAARGRALQAGLYYNPTVGVTGEEIGRRGGIYTLPLISQEIVTGGKLGLSRAVAERQTDQTLLALQRQRYALFTTVRQGYFEVLAGRRRIEVLTDLVGLADQSLENARKLLEAKVIAELDVLQFEVERDRFRADLDAARNEEAAAWRRLAAEVGAPDLPRAPLVNLLGDVLPDYGFDEARAFVLEEHPEVRSARVGVRRAQLALRRAEVETVPNVTVDAGYQRNINDRENEAHFQVSLPVPLWNRNQGNILAAQAEVGRSLQEVGRVQNDLTGRLAAAFGRYAAAREREKRYHTSVLPNAQKAYRLAQEAFKGGQFEYLRVLQAQRAAAEANLEYVRVQSEAWQAASEIAGLLLEEYWPARASAPAAGPTPGK
jgi:outer membrane protein, heavy metal efflux system